MPCLLHSHTLNAQSRSHSRICGTVNTEHMPNLTFVSVSGSSRSVYCGQPFQMYIKLDRQQTARTDRIQFFFCVPSKNIN